MGFPDAELSVTFTSDDGISELGERYGRPPRPTDVLAFALGDAPGAEHAGETLGDVVISIETAERQARRRRVSLDRELDDLLIHGVLHLVGMDHERAGDAACMRVLEDHLRWTLRRLA